MLRRWNEESHNGKTLLEILAYEFLFARNFYPYLCSISFELIAKLTNVISYT